MISFVDSMAAPLSLLNALIAELGRRRKDDVDGVFAEMERNMTSDRVRSGMKNARAKGKRIGRPEVTKDTIDITPQNIRSISDSLQKEK